MILLNRNIVNKNKLWGGPLSSSKRQDPGQMSILIVMNIRDVKN